MKTTYLSLGLVLVAVLAPPSVLAQKATDGRVNTDPAGSSNSGSHVIAASGSSVYVAWLDDRDNPGSGVSGIYFNRSLDGGANWLASDKKVDTGAMDASRPQIAASGSSVYVTWATDEGIHLNRSVDGGTTWLPSEVQLSSGYEQHQTASLELSGSSVYVTWTALRERVDEGSHSVMSLYFNHSLDGGITWQGERELETSISNDLLAFRVRASQLAASGSSVYVTWEKLDMWNNPDPIWGGWIGDSVSVFSRSHDSGTTWTPITLGHHPFHQLMAPRIASSGSAVYLAWSDNSGSPTDIYFNRSLNGGTNWLPAGNLHLNYVAGTAERSDPQLAVSGSWVYVAWLDHRNRTQAGTNDIYFNRSPDGGYSWLFLNNKRLNTDPPGMAERSELQLAASSSSVYVTWRDTRNGAGDIYFNRSLDGGTTWLTSDVRMNRDPAGAAEDSRPQIAASDSSVYVTWLDSRNSTQAGVGDIYFNIPFGSLPYGTGKAGSDGLVPHLEGSDDLHPGSTLSLTVSGGLGGADGLFAFGFAGSKTSIPVVGGTLLVNSVAVLPFTLGGTEQVPGDGVFVLDIPIPADVNLLGVNLNTQVGLLDPGATFGVSLSNAVEAWIH